MTTSITKMTDHGSERPRLLAGDVMTSDVATLVTTTIVGEAMSVMRTLGIRHLPVLGEGLFVVSSTTDWRPWHC